MKGWIVELTCVKCRDAVEVCVLAGTEAEAKRNAERAHNENHAQRGDIGKVWPDCCCWAVKANSLPV